ARRPHPGGHETVLVVEDELTLGRLFRGSLDVAGYTVLEATQGDEALRISQAHLGPIHLLVTDVELPGLSGRELAQRVTARRPETKVLFISGYTDDAVLRHGVLHAESAFLQKPFTSDVLTGKVREVLQTDRR